MPKMTWWGKLPTGEKIALLGVVAALAAAVISPLLTKALEATPVTIAPQPSDQTSTQLSAAPTSVIPDQSTPIVSSATARPITPEATSPGAPSSPKTDTPVPPAPTESPAPTSTAPQPPQGSTPVPPGQPMRMGDSRCTDNNLCIALTSYLITEKYIALTFTISNRGPEAILVRYRNSNFQVSDDTGKVYQQPVWTFQDVKQRQLAAGESVQLASETSAANHTTEFSTLGRFDGVASEQAKFIQVAVSQFMGVSDLKWQIADLNPSAGQPQNTADSPLARGQSYQGNGLSITLTDYKVFEGYWSLKFTVRNDSSSDIVVRYRNSSFQVSDDSGKIYEQPSWTYPDVKQRALSTGESILLASETSAANHTSNFDTLGRFDGVASEQAHRLYVTVSQFMGLADLKWEVVELNPTVDAPQSPPGNEPLAVGETYHGSGLRITLTERTIFDKYIALKFLVQNESAANIVIRYRNGSFQVSDDTGKMYGLPSWTYLAVKQRELAPGESLILASETSAANHTAAFNTIGRFEGVASEQARFFYVKITQLMGLSNLNWQVSLN